MDESFGKKEKLKSKVLVDRLFMEGKSITRFPLKLVYSSIPNPAINSHKTGVSVPKRNFKRAVDRNHLKRLMREAFRKNKYLVSNNMDQYFALMFIYIGKKPEDYQKLHSITKELLEKFVQKELRKGK